MALEWNSTACPWQSTALPWKVTGLPYNATGLPWKVGSGGGDPPNNTLAPAISDSTPEVGNILTCTDGNWTGSPTFTYQWYHWTGTFGGHPVGTAIPSANLYAYQVVA